MFDENKPFPCSHPSCHSFHSSESGYCERHRWSGLGRRICVAGNSWRQNVELSVLILAQAVAEVESRFLLVLLVLSLLPVASYSFSQSAGVSGTLIFLIIISIAIVSIFYTQLGSTECTHCQGGLKLNRKLCMQRICRMTCPGFLVIGAEMILPSLTSQA